MSSDIKVTPEVRLDSTVLYLIRVNGEEMAFAESADEANLIVDSTAAFEQRRLENDWTTVFRQDLDEGRKVVISTQSLGYAMNGSIYKVSTIDYVSVSHAYLVRGRHELPNKKNKIFEESSEDEE